MLRVIGIVRSGVKSATTIGLRGSSRLLPEAGAAGCHLTIRNDPRSAEFVGGTWWFSAYSSWAIFHCVKGQRTLMSGAIRSLQSSSSLLAGNRLLFRTFASLGSDSGVFSLFSFFHRILFTYRVVEYWQAPILLPSLSPMRWWRLQKRGEGH